MKHLKCLLACACALLPIHSASAQDPVVLLGWDFNGITSTDSFGPSPFAATESSADVTSSGLIRNFDPGTGTPAARGWGSNNWFDASGDFDAAVAGNRFVTFSISPAAGKTVSLSAVEAFNVRRSNSGPTTGKIQYQINGGDFFDVTGDIAWGTVTNADGNPQAAVDLSGVSDLQNLQPDQTVTFRIVNWGATSAGGTWYLNEGATQSAGVSDFKISGILGDAGPDENPPTVVSYVPGRGATEVSASVSSLSVTFSEDVFTNANPADVVLREVGNPSPIATISVPGANASLDGRTLELVLPVALDPDTTYSVTLADNLVRDGAGNQFVGFSDEMFWTFSTAAAAPLGPQITFLSPSNGETEVVPGFSPAMSFDRDVFPGTGMIEIRRADDDSVVLALDAADPFEVDVFGNQVTLLVAFDTFEQATEYYIEVPAGAVEDVNEDGNAAITGKGGPGSWVFTTQSPDMSPPVIISRVPAAGSQRASVLGDVTITFDEAVQFTGNPGELSLRLAADGSLVESVAIGSASVAGNSVTFPRGVALDFETDYYIELGGGLIADLEGNGFGAISGSTAWAFGTGPVPSVVINKYSNSGPDAIELLVTGDLVPGSTVDLRGMILKDFSSNMNNDGGGKFEFAADPLWEAVPVGTLIVIPNDATESDTDDSDFTIEVGLGNATYFTKLGTGSFDVATTDLIMIKEAGSDPLGTAGGIHAFGAGAAGSRFLEFEGAKLLAAATTGANLAAFANNSTAGILDFFGSDATGGTAAASLDFGQANNSTNQAFIFSLRGLEPSVGDGVAEILNVTPSSAYNGTEIFAANSAGQSARITLLATVPGNTLDRITLSYPLAFGAPLAGNVALSGAGATGAVVAVNGQDIEISGAAVTVSDPLVITLGGITTPVPDAATDLGNFLIPIATSGGAGDPGPIVSSPSLRVPVPILALRENVDGQSVHLGSFVVVEGVATYGNFSTAGTNGYIQDAGAGVNVFSAGLEANLVRGRRYAVAGTVAVFRGLTEVIFSGLSDVVDLGEDLEPLPLTVSIAQLLADPESYEGLLIRVNGLSRPLDSTNEWALASTVVLADVSDARIDVRIQSGSTAVPEPAYPVDVVGVFGQFSSSASAPFAANGYQIQPRDPGDLIPSAGGGDTYAEWIAGFNVGGFTGIGDDFDGDGIPNGVENYFGSAPDDFNQGLVIVGKTGDTFTFSHPLSAMFASDLSASYEWSTNLEDWNSSGETFGGTTVQITMTPSAGVATVDAVVSGGVAEDLFVRVKVE